MNFEQYLQKTYYSWLGKNIGIRLGAPIEGYDYEYLKNTYQEITDYVVDYDTFAADDDANGPLFFAKALDKIERLADPKHYGNTLLNYLSNGHGFFWWGGVGVSTEHTAYHNLQKGIDAPLSGSAQVNGDVMANQIGGQIFSDCWGYVSLGNPEIAKDLASKMAAVTHDQDGIQGAIFIACAIAYSYQENDCATVINLAQQHLDKTSNYYQIIEEIKNFKNENDNWLDCLNYIRNNHGYDKYPGICHIIPNTAIMIMAMLYGDNNFTSIMSKLAIAGWDTDCNLGNVGSIIGPMFPIDQHWIKPLKDHLISSSIIGSLNIDSISQTALQFAIYAFQLAGKEIPQKYLKYTSKQVRQFLFYDRFTTAGWQMSSDRYSEGNLAVINNKLRCIVHNGYQDHALKIFLKTYFLPNELYDHRYQPTFSPIVYPNETITAVICNEQNWSTTVQFYVLTNYEGIVCSDLFPLGNKDTFIWQIPANLKGTIMEIGLIIPYETRYMQTYIDVQEIKIDRNLAYHLDFSLQENVDYGLDFVNQRFSEVSQFTSLNNQLSIVNDALVIHDDYAITGDIYAAIKKINFEFSALDSFELCFGFRGIMNYYALRILKTEILIVYKDVKETILKRYTIDKDYFDGEKHDFSLNIVDVYGINQVRENVSAFENETKSLIGCYGWHNLATSELKIFNCSIQGATDHLFHLEEEKK